MASLQSTHSIPRPFAYQLTPIPRNHRTLTFYRGFPISRLRTDRFFSLRERCLGKHKGSCRYLIRCNANNTEIDQVDVEKVEERPPFDINLAVVLAGFAFEAYTSPPERVGRREIDAAGCKTVYLSESFVREIYDGQLFIKLNKGIELPIMDPWGTSDPYVVFQLDGQYAKSKIKWGKKEPTWNEDFTFNIKQSQTKNLQIATWDANLVTPHKRMGNASINLESVCDGELHELIVDLEGMGGGGKLQLEVKYKTFDEIAEEKKWWKLPFVTEFLKKNGFESAMKAVASESVPARQFVDYAFGQLKDRILKSSDSEGAEKLKNPDVSETVPEIQSTIEASLVESETTHSTESNSDLAQTNNDSLDEESAAEVTTHTGETVQSEKDFWKNFADTINQTVVQLGPSVPLDLKWDSMELLKRIGLQSQRDAEAGYIESGLATPDDQDVEDGKSSKPVRVGKIQSSIPDIKKATQELLGQTDSILGAFMVMTAAVSKLNKEAQDGGKGSSETENLIRSLNGSVIDEKKAEEMRKLFSTAETAMEAWAMLATSLGQTSFIKSEFEKICFLDNESTDTQVAIWRDSSRRRLVVAFRGTEQSKWKDLRTDLMLAPAGLNPERIGGDFNREVQVHSGFLQAYDSVRIRIISVLKLAIGFLDDATELQEKWHVYITGHSLGGALATLLALELSSSQLAKRAAISVTMYNFGSPRVGNRRFVEVYNQKVKDSWRVVNHRDIIPTVPRLMGYCHVAQPVYLAAGELKDALENMELMTDGYQIDVLAEYTPNVIVDHFMKGEKELVEKILQTEINIFRSLRDGSALMQHMEDFYYITLLEKVRSNYQTAGRIQSNEQESVTTS